MSLTPAEKLAREVRRLRRDWAILDARSAGVPVRQIAAAHGLTPMRVYQVCKR